MRQLTHIRAIRAHEIEIGALDRLEAIRPPQLRRIAIGGECDPLPVRRPCGTEVPAGMLRQIGELFRFQVQQPDLRVAAAGRDEGQLAAVRCQRRLIVKGRIVGQALEPGAVRACAINVRGSALIRCEDNPRAVAGKRGIPLLRGAGMEDLGDCSPSVSARKTSECTGAKLA